MRDPDFTLAAGPTAATARTLAALGSPITYHYDPVFLDAFRRTEAKVGQLFRTGNEIVLMQGEAILGLEAAARSLVRPGMPVLNLVSGVFGKGMGPTCTSWRCRTTSPSTPGRSSVTWTSIRRPNCCAWSTPRPRREPSTTVP